MSNCAVFVPYTSYTFGVHLMYRIVHIPYNLFAVYINMKLRIIVLSLLLCVGQFFIIKNMTKKTSFISFILSDLSVKGHLCDVTEGLSREKQVTNPH